VALGGLAVFGAVLPRWTGRIGARLNAEAGGLESSLFRGRRNRCEFPNRWEENPWDREKAAEGRDDDGRVQPEGLSQGPAQEASERERAPHEEPHRGIEPALEAKGHECLAEAHLVDVVPERAQRARESHRRQERERHARGREDDPERARGPHQKAQEDRTTDAEPARDSVRGNRTEDPADAPESADDSKSDLVQPEVPDRIQHEKGEQGWREEIRGSRAACDRPKPAVPKHHPKAFTDSFGTDRRSEAFGTVSGFRMRAMRPAEKKNDTPSKAIAAAYPSARMTKPARTGPLTWAVVLVASSLLFPSTIWSRGTSAGKYAW